MTTAVLIDEDQALRALAGLAQAQRLRVFRSLVGAGPAGLTPTALAEELGTPASTLSFHLKELMHAGLVTQQRQGRHLIYRPALAHMTGLVHYLTAHCCERADDPSDANPATCGPQTALDCC
jgi:ArsR family transcriptional regulator, arsenate/arsenite/antimonite-responsive transcriptional repressor